MLHGRRAGTCIVKFAVILCIVGVNILCLIRENYTLKKSLIQLGVAQLPQENVKI